MRNNIYYGFGQLCQRVFEFGDNVWSNGYYTKEIIRSLKLAETSLSF